MRHSTKMKAYSFISRFTRTVSVVCLFTVFFGLLLPLNDGAPLLAVLPKDARSLVEALLVITVFLCSLDIFLRLLDRDYDAKTNKNTLYCID